MRYGLCMLLCLQLFCCLAQKRSKTDRLLADFDYAVQELKTQHQGYYHYLDTATVDTQVRELRNRITSGATKLEFYAVVRRLVALMNEGHGSVELPKLMKTKIGLSRSFFPLALRYLDGNWIVTQHFGEADPGLSKGARILSINGESMETVFEKLAPLIATDGFNETSRFEWMGGLSLSLLYRLVYGKKEEFRIRVDAYDTGVEQDLKIPAVKFTAFKSRNAKFAGRSFNYNSFGFKILEDSIAYLSVPDFSKGEIDYEAFYRRHFRTIDSLHIRHLIVDIQANTGGEEGNENLLFSYLSSERLRKYRRVTMMPKPYQKRKKYNSIRLDRWMPKGTLAERGDFTLYSDYYSTLGYSSPDPNHVYTGKVYVLTSGLTFSGGAEFASMVRMSRRGVFIGAETGGAYEGNVSSFNETVKLPHTGIRIDIPIVHFQMNVDPVAKGRGILPDHPLPQTRGDYMHGRNAKLEYALRLIKGSSSN